MENKTSLYIRYIAHTFHTIIAVNMWPLSSITWPHTSNNNKACIHNYTPFKRYGATFNKILYKSKSVFTCWMTEDKKCMVIFKNIFCHTISFGLEQFIYASDWIFLTFIVIHVNYLRSSDMPVTFLSENIMWTCQVQVTLKCHKYTVHWIKSIKLLVPERIETVSIAE